MTTATVLHTRTGEEITCGCGQCVAVARRSDGGAGQIVTWHWAEAARREGEAPTATMEAGECEECGGGILSAALRLVS